MISAVELAQARQALPRRAGRWTRAEAGPRDHLRGEALIPLARAGAAALLAQLDYALRLHLHLRPC